MKFINTQEDIRSAFESQLVCSDLVNCDFNPKQHAKPLFQTSNASRLQFNDYPSNFFTSNNGKNDDHDRLINDLRFKDIFSTDSKIDKTQDNSTKFATDEQKEVSWQNNRKWLSTVFVIWFFLAFALLLNSIYY